MVWIWGGSLLDQMLLRKSSGQALQMAQELARFAVPHLFVRQELANALITG